MTLCSVCSTPTSWEQGTAYTAEEFRWMVFRGFEPAETTIQSALTAGWTREQIVAQWRQAIMTQPATGWYLLCPACAARAAAILPKAPGLAVAVPATGAGPVPAGPAPRRSTAMPVLISLAVVLLLGLVAIGALLATGGTGWAPATPVAKQPTPTHLGTLVATGFSSTSLPSPKPEPTLRPVEPTARPTLRTATPVPATSRPTGAAGGTTPLPDLSAATLTQADMPPDLTQMLESELEAMGINEETLARSMSSFTQARPDNLAAFANYDVDNLQVAFSCLIYPLTPMEQASFDLSLRNPELALATFGGALAQGGATTEPRLIPGMDRLGDQSIGITTDISVQDIALKLDLGLIRRGAVVEIVMIFYLAENEPSITVQEMARILDSRVATALGQ